jgi:4'-phosphopantetheinyl transferase EntD
MADGAVFTAATRAREVASRIARWLPPATEARAVCVDDAREVLPAESGHLARAVRARRAEFAAGRAAAREALHALGFPAEPIPAGRLGEPLWPRGASGSIAHDGGIAVAIAHRGAAHLGVDVCALESEWPRDAEDLIAGPREWAELSHWKDVAGPLLFSAKEAVIKALSPALDRLVDFREFRLVFRDGDFRCASSGFEVSGRCAVVEGYVVSMARAARAPQRTA